MARKTRGFSLAEVLIAVGILGMGLLMVAAVFPVAIHYTTVSTDRTIAAVTADEAFAKIKLYAEGKPLDLTDDLEPGLYARDSLKDFNDALPVRSDIDVNEFAYPSAGTNIKEKQYFWWALCRLDESGAVQVTVFVSKRSGMGRGVKYYDKDGTVWPATSANNQPRPVRVAVDTVGSNPAELQVKKSNEKVLINDGDIIVDDKTGRIYRVLERYKNEGNDEDEVFLLDKRWEGGGGAVWVVPQPAGGGRTPCVAVYQRLVEL